MSIVDLLEYSRNTYKSFASMDARGRVIMEENGLFVAPEYCARHYAINMIAEGEEASNENRYPHTLSIQLN